MTRKMYWIAKIVLISAGCFLLYIAYWTLFPFRGLEVKNEPVPVDRKIVTQGDSLIYYMDFCRYTDKPAIVTRKFVDGIVFTTDPQAVASPAGCGERGVLVNIPENLPPDTYTLKILVQIKINPLRTLTTEFVTEKFEVVKK